MSDEAKDLLKYLRAIVAQRALECDRRIKDEEFLYFNHERLNEPEGAMKELFENGYVSLIYAETSDGEEFLLGYQLSKGFRLIRYLNALLLPKYGRHYRAEIIPKCGN